MEEQAQIQEAEEGSKILYGVDAWVDYLKDKSFPVRASSLKRLKILLSKDSTMISHLTALVRSDPVLCLHVVRAAEKKHAKKGSHVTSIEHAVSSLGIDPLIQLSKTLQPVKLNPSSVQQKQYLRTVANSHHAAIQARTWQQMKRLPFTEEVYLASLFYSIGLWALWLNAPLHMHKVRIKIWEENIDPTLAEHDILGCTMQQISMGLSEHWGFSELTLQAQDPDTSPSKGLLNKLHQRALSDPRLSAEELRELNHLTQERHFPIKLANWLSLIVSRGWRTTRNIKTTDIISDYLGLDTDKTLALLHTLCAEASREYHAPGTLAPAAEMLMISSSYPNNYKLGKRELELLTPKYPIPEKPKPKKKKTPTKVKPKEQVLTHTPETLLDEVIYKQIVERFVKDYHLYTKPAHILQGLMQGLVQGLGLQRIALNLVNTKSHKMKTAQVVGIDKEHPFASYQIDLQIPSIFKKLCDKPACIWITNENKQQYTKLMPDAYSSQLPESDCLMMSVFRGKVPVAIIYADAGETGLPFTAFHHQRFRYLCSAATLALKRM
ncbi:HDOD domain-containing protein [Neptunomonas japonica]|uniref:HDOD domain-containing protein n=1 Tax=Neptunomonas japonica TaxID=417574 RepID=UPI0004143A17|nr:HDOD domain-containing protein [Neptunomonas japonica]